MNTVRRYVQLKWLIYLLVSRTMFIMKYLYKREWLGGVANKPILMYSF